MPARVSADTFESEVLESQIPVLVDFYSDSCVPCKKIAPVLSKLETEYAEKVKIVKINTNFDTEITEKYGIEALFAALDELKSKTGFGSYIHQSKDVWLKTLA